MTTIDSNNNMATKTALYLQSASVCEALLTNVLAPPTQTTDQTYEGLQNLTNAKLRLNGTYTEIKTILREKQEQSIQKVAEMRAKIVELARDIKEVYTTQARDKHHSKAS
jgi:hypothetical protein